MNQAANSELMTPRRSLKKGMLSDIRNQRPVSPLDKLDATHTSAMTNAKAQIAVHIPIHVSQPVHEWVVICLEWTPFLRNLSKGGVNFTENIKYRPRAPQVTAGRSWAMRLRFRRNT